MIYLHEPFLINNKQVEEMVINHFSPPKDQRGARLVSNN